MEMTNTIGICVEDITRIITELGGTATDELIKQIDEDLDAQAAQDPTGWWGVWVEDLWYQYKPEDEVSSK